MNINIQLGETREKFILTYDDLQNLLMHYSAQNRESRSKDSTRNKKDSKVSERKISAKTGSNSKTSGKSTPKQSKDKRQAQQHKQKENEDLVKSDYYNNQNYGKYNQKRNSNSIIEDTSVNNKKSRRNMGTSKSKRQSSEFDPFNASQLDQYQQRVLFQESDSDHDPKLKSPILKKIKQLSSQGSIDFNGQIVRESRLRTSQKNIGIGQLTEQDYSGYQGQKNKKSNKSKGATKSKSKSKQKSIKGTLKNKKKNSDNTKDHEKVGKSTEGLKKVKSMDEQQKYVISPYENPYKPAGPIEIAELQQQVQEDLENAYEYILSQELIKERGQCLNMLGKICSSMNLKRQTFSAALSYIDSFIDINTEVKTIKTITIAALMMALKIDHAQMIGTGLQLSTISSMQSFTSTKAMSVSTEARSLQKKGKRKDSSSKHNSGCENYDNSKQLKFNLNRPKLPNVLTTVLSHEEIFSEYDRILCKEQIMDMQMQMMVKLNFKLTIRSFTFWIDSLTSLWDTYILQSYSKLKSKVSFRTPECIKNLSYILGLVEVSYYFPYAYFYPKVILILSIMYLLVRIRIEYAADKEDKGFEHYRVNLGKSTNLIFVDKMGSNQLFGEFLAMLKLDMGDIVSCCQYVSHYFNSKILRVYSFQTNRSMSYEQHISAYHYNPEIYRFFQVKSGGVLNSACSHSEKAQVFY